MVNSLSSSSLPIMKRELIMTSDGSHTVAVSGWNVTYHSIHGAVQESRHVYIEAGLNYALSTFANDNRGCLRIFEMGFGTGLNALLSLAEAKAKQTCLYYQSVELYPLLPDEAKRLNYISLLKDESLAEPFLQMHQCAPNEDVMITLFFTLHKSETSLLDINTASPFHLVYFDAFAPDVQPELWTLSIFQQMYNLLHEGGVLVTYCSKGAVRRTMQAAGFTVEKVKGPPGKREMVRAIKR